MIRQYFIRGCIEATAGTLVSGKPDNTFYGISTDSRQVFKGNLFIALKGENLTAMILCGRR